MEGPAGNGSRSPGQNGRVPDAMKTFDQAYRAAEKRYGAGHIETGNTVGGSRPDHAGREGVHLQAQAYLKRRFAFMKAQCGTDSVERSADCPATGGFA
jgi:hypothetical protein